MRFPRGLSDNLKPRSHCSNSLAGTGRSTEARACCKEHLGCAALETKQIFTGGGTLPAWDCRHVLGLRMVIRAQDTQLFLNSIKTEKNCKAASQL